MKICNDIQLIGNEDVQEYPIGTWKPIMDFKDLYDILNSQERVEDEATFLLNLKDFNLEKEKEYIKNTKEKTKSEAREFKFDLNDPFENQSFEEKEEPKNLIEEKVDPDNSSPDPEPFLLF